MTKLEILSMMILDDTKYVPGIDDEDKGHLIITGDHALGFIRAAFPYLYKEALDQGREEYKERKEAQKDDTV